MAMASATDVITFVGVPLAVLGVLPILYTCIRSLLTLRSIRRVLSHNWLLDSAVMRANLMSGLVEVELPRCTITPLDRGLDPEYWKLNPYCSSIRGGSWSMFYWNSMVTGTKLYRCQYKDELRSPQAEIDFEELLVFLLDRGAIPDPKGWHMLKTSGLWTPAGTPLLLPPIGHPGAVLRVDLPDDSDGVLSLKVNWQSDWDNRSSTSLPPFWMRLKQPCIITGDANKNISRTSESQDGGLPALDTACANSESVFKSERKADEKNGADSTHATESLQSSKESEPSGEHGSPGTPSLPQLIERSRVSLHGNAFPSDALRFCVTEKYVSRIHFEYQGVSTGKSQELWTSEEAASLWFVCAASATGHDNPDSGLWNYAIPRDIVTFSKKAVIPCGLMVLLDILEESDVPPWASPMPKPGMDVEAQHRKYLESQRQRTLENHMPPAQAAMARRARELEELRSFHDQFRQSLQKKREYEEKREIEALGSQRLENKVVVEANLAYLVRESLVPDSYSIEQLAQAVLYLIVLDKEQAKNVTEMLDQWLAWSLAGGLNKTQWAFLKENKLSFCYASALVSLIGRVGSSTTQVSSDMFDCIRMWKRIRLG